MANGYHKELMVNLKQFFARCKVFIEQFKLAIGYA